MINSSTPPTITKKVLLCRPNCHSLAYKQAHRDEKQKLAAKTNPGDKKSW